MKLSEKTLEILKNFSTINTNLFIEKGSQIIRTVADSKHVFAEVTVDETFPVDVGVLNLHKLLQTISMFDDPDLVFEDTHIVIKDGKSRSKFKYLYTAPSCLTYPKASPKDFEAPCSFVLNENTLGQIVHASRVASLPDVKISYDSNVVTLNIMDRTLPKTNVFSLEVDGQGPAPTTAFMKVDNLKMIPTEYNMNFGQRAARLRSASPEYSTLQYCIAMDVASNNVQ